MKSVGHTSHALCAEGRHLLITGGTGYIGTALVRLAVTNGCVVTVLSRTRPTWPFIDKVRYVPYALTEPLPPEAFDAAEVVIHLAADTSQGLKRLPEQVEVDAGRRLLTAASTHGLRFLFVSSQSARADAPTPYGRIKWRIEQTVLQHGGYVVRPGLVYGGTRAAGLFGTLCGFVQRAPILPDLRPRPVVQPLHLHDLCSALLQLACDPEAQPGAYNLGDPQGVSFTDCLKAIARYHVCKTRLFVPVPMRVLIVLTHLQTAGSWFPNFDGERLRSLAALRLMETHESMRQLDLESPALAVGLQRGVTRRFRRCLAWEGYALCSYVMTQRPVLGLVKRYIRGVERLFGGTPLPVPGIFLQWSWLFSLLDMNHRLLDLSGWRQFPDRLALALTLAEASPLGAEQFLQLRRRRHIGAWLSLLGLAMREAIVRIAQTGATIVARLWFRRR